MTRDQFIPVRKTDILTALLADERLADAPARENFRQLCRLLGSILHYEYFEELERLKDAYFYFNPQIAGQGENAPGASSQAYEALVADVRKILARANFVEVPAEEIERANRERGLLPVEVKAPFDDYRDVRFFRRGQHRETVEMSEWLGYRKTTIEVDVYDDVVVLAAVKPAGELVSRDRRKKTHRRKLRHGTVLIKYFRDIASADLNTLLPDVQVIMNLRDKWMLGLPALFGGIPLLLKLAPTLAVLFVLVGVRFGFAGAAEDDEFKQALAVMSGFIALGSFIIHQWLKYQRQALRYQIEINDNIYFRNLNNNSGIFDTIIGAAEEQEWKEACLAYFFLGAEPLSEEALDRRIEAWLKERFAVDVDFEVEDGIAKLERLGLLARSGDRLSVVPVSEALQRLDRRWDDFFRFNQAAE